MGDYDGKVNNEVARQVFISRSLFWAVKFSLKHLGCRQTQNMETYYIKEAVFQFSVMGMQTKNNSYFCKSITHIRNEHGLRIFKLSQYNVLDCNPLNKCQIYNLYLQTPPGRMPMWFGFSALWTLLQHDVWHLSPPAQCVRHCAGHRPLCLHAQPHLLLLPFQVGDCESLGKKWERYRRNVEKYKRRHVVTVRDFLFLNKHCNTACHSRIKEYKTTMVLGF